MSRYKVSRYVGLTPLVYDVTGPGNQVIARMWSSNEDEVAHLARFIETHDEIVDVLRDVAEALHKQVDGPAVVRPSEIDKFARLYELVNDVDALINRIDGEEAQ